jgi:transposase
MQRRIFSRELKLEAVKLIKERGVAVAQAARDIDVAESDLRRWLREGVADPQQACPGHGQLKPEQQEVTLRIPTKPATHSNLIAATIPT